MLNKYKKAYQETNMEIINDTPKICNKAIITSTLIGEEIETMAALSDCTFEMPQSFTISEGSSLTPCILLGSLSINEIPITTSGVYTINNWEIDVQFISCRPLVNPVSCKKINSIYGIYLGDTEFDPLCTTVEAILLDDSTNTHVNIGSICVGMTPELPNETLVFTPPLQIKDGSLKIGGVTVPTTGISTSIPNWTITVNSENCN